MHPRLSQGLKKSLLAPSILLLTLGMGQTWADDSGFWGRLFRLGGGSSPSNTNSTPPDQGALLPDGRNLGSTANSAQPAPASSLAPAPLPAFGGLPQTPVTTPPSAAALPGQRLSPKPRVSPAVTTADPVLTRLALGRSNDGSQFGMLMQVFADGTVIDSEGVHHLRPADLKPIVDSVQSGDLVRIRGHCGAPATDFIEYVHIVVFERRFGRLSAHSFSYSGNAQGCDHAIHHLHTILEKLQAKLSRQPVMNNSGAGISSEPAPLGSPPVQTGATNLNLLSPGPALGVPSNRQPMPPSVNPGGAAPAGPVIPLTPLDSSH
jgi:hypothetical protein